METNKTSRGLKKSKDEDSSSEFVILNIINKTTVEGPTNEFDCDATLGPVELTVKKKKKKKNNNSYLHY
jgi:hypothetical protein